MSRVLAVDLGGSALKAALLSLDGAVAATASSPTGFDEDASGRSEQDPERWWQAFTEAVEALQAEAGLQDVVAVAACGATRSQVLLDTADRVVRPAIGFRDSRAGAAAAAALRRPGMVDHPEARHLDGFHPLARLLWLREAEPEAWAATRRVLDPKDWLVQRLTGRAASDPVSQQRLGAAFADGERSLAALAGLDRAVLPPLLAPEEPVGEVRAGLDGALGALAGLPVVCGSHDVWCAVAGLGALAAGCGYCITGSSESTGLIAPRPGQAEGLLTVRWAADLWQIGGPGLNGANLMVWLGELLAPGGGSPEARIAALSPAPATGPALLFHPYLHGERTPFWDAGLRAAVLGLDRGHGPAELVRAVMEGVGLLNREVLERAEAAAGLRAERVYLAGGGARNAAWTQIRADLLGREIVVPHEVDAGLAGCLALARTGLGDFPDVTAAARAIARRPRTVRPNPAMGARSDALFAAFRALHPAVTEAAQLLARVPPASPEATAP